MSEARNVVLVHGGFVDGSGWEGVYDLLKADGFNVSVVQNPTVSLDDDVARPGTSSISRTARRSSSATPTAASSSPRPAATTNVAGLVYIAAFAPDAGESVNTLIADPPPGAPVPPILPPQTGSCSWTARSSPTRSRRTSRPSWRRSWPTRRSRGASRRSTAPSASPPGAASRAGTWSPLTTG